MLSRLELDVLAAREAVRDAARDRLKLTFEHATRLAECAQLVLMLGVLVALAAGVVIVFAQLGLASVLSGVETGAARAAAASAGAVQNKPVNYGEIRHVRVVGLDGSGTDLVRRVLGSALETSSGEQKVDVMGGLVAAGGALQRKSDLGKARFGFTPPSLKSTLVVHVRRNPMDTYRDLHVGAFQDARGSMDCFIPVRKSALRYNTVRQAYAGKSIEGSCSKSADLSLYTHPGALLHAHLLEHVNWESESAIGYDRPVIGGRRRA